jgi:protease I
VDEPVIRDGNLITSRKPVDIPKFNKAIIDVLKEWYGIDHRQANSVT